MDEPATGPGNSPRPLFTHLPIRGDGSPFERRLCQPCILGLGERTIRPFTKCGWIRSFGVREATRAHGDYHSNARGA
jgi:hypothetical protein